MDKEGEHQPATQEIRDAWKEGEDLVGLGTVKDFVRAILEQTPSEFSQASDIHYRGTMAMNVDGRKVIMEAVVTMVDGVKCGEGWATSALDDTKQAKEKE
jgi:hypothetical protein